MAETHANQVELFGIRQAERYGGQVDNPSSGLGDSLGYVFDRNGVLVGYVVDTSESVAALSLLDFAFCDEVYPESREEETFACYVRMCDRLGDLGYTVVDAEWWRKKREPSYSIASLPEQLSD